MSALLVACARLLESLARLGNSQTDCLAARWMTHQGTTPGSYLLEFAKCAANQIFSRMNSSRWRETSDGRRASRRRRTGLTHWG